MFSTKTMDVLQKVQITDALPLFAAITSLSPKAAQFYDSSDQRKHHVEKQQSQPVPALRGAFTTYSVQVGRGC